MRPHLDQYLNSQNPRSIVLFACLSFLVMLAGTATGSLVGPPSHNQVESEPAVPWWDDTNMDRDGNHLHDALDIALTQGVFRDERDRIMVLVDFDHMPTGDDIALLEDNVDFEHRFIFHYIPIISGWVPVERIPDLLDLPGVVFLTLNGPVEVLMEGARSEHHVEPQVWDMGYDGSGVAVAIIDTGIDDEHIGIDDFDDDPSTYDPKVIAFYDAITSPDVTDGSTEPYDGHGHGSHCSGIATGTGDGSDSKSQAGIAPGASLVGVKVLSDSGSGSFDQVMQGMEWTIDNKAKYNIRGASMSLGGAWVSELTQEQEERLTHLANKMVAHGIALAIAAGNDGGYGTIGTPGAAKDVITVGATEHDRSLAIYSSKGPTHEGQIKPNLVAIGSSVVSVEANSGNGYVAMSGTSMATPMVAGMAALILEANPDMHPLMARRIMEETSEFRMIADPQRPNNDYGWGFVEADKAMEAAISYSDNFTVELDPDTPIVTIKKSVDNGDSNVTQTATRYAVEQGEDLEFIVEGEPLALEWRAIYIGNASWSWIEPEESMDKDDWNINVNPAQFPTGNITIWVRAAGSNEQIGAPLFLQLYVEAPPAIEEDEEGPPILVLGLLALVVATGIFGFIFGRRIDDALND